MTFRCPRGCVWLLAKGRRLYDGVACPRHQLYCPRDGRATLWPFYRVRPKP